MSAWVNGGRVPVRRMSMKPTREAWSERLAPLLGRGSLPLPSRAAHEDACASWWQPVD